MSAWMLLNCSRLPPAATQDHSPAIAYSSTAYVATGSFILAESVVLVIEAQVSKIRKMLADFPRVARTHKYSAVYCYGGAWLSAGLMSSLRLTLYLSLTRLRTLSSRRSCCILNSFAKMLPEGHRRSEELSWRLVLPLDESCKFHEDIPMPLQLGTLIRPKCELSQDISNLASDSM